MSAAARSVTAVAGPLVTPGAGFRGTLARGLGQVRDGVNQLWGGFGLGTSAYRHNSAA